MPGKNPQADLFYPIPPEASQVHAINSREWLLSSMVVPVWLSHKDKETLVYAILDNQSDKSLILK